LSRTINPAVTVIALGGNAILHRGERGTFEEQYRNVQRTSSRIAKLIHDGRNIVITHGNGPQIGATLIRHESASSLVPPFPLHACGAETQGFLGYVIQQTLQSALRKLGSRKSVVTLVTQTLVDKNDPAFQNPTKPVGPYYTNPERQMLSRSRSDLEFKEDSGKGFRRVVPSPDPKMIIETEAILSLVSQGIVVVACGGGGVPVIGSQAQLNGVDAVIDKDLAAERLATSIHAMELVILTDVDGIYLDYRKKNRRLLSEVKVAQLQEFAALGHFAAGSMGPKVEATIRFVVNGGRRAIIAELDSIEDAIQGFKGTQITG
jgi:carbamate kinase